MVTDLEESYSLFRVDLENFTEQIFHIRGAVLHLLPSGFFYSSSVAELRSQLCKLSFLFFRWQIRVKL
jgi:hypothetical protein